MTRFAPATPTERRYLALLIAMFICAGTAFTMATPMFENPDEATHVDMVRHYSRHPFDLAGPSLRQSQAVRDAFGATGLFDTRTDAAFDGVPTDRPDYRSFDSYAGDEPATSCPVTCQNYQYIHPPAWYLATAPVAWMLQGQEFPYVIFALRGVNVLLVSIVVWCAWRIARDLWPDRLRRAFLAAALTTSAGPLAAAAASVNNDGLMIALSGLALVLLTRVLLAGATLRRAVGLGAVVGLGLLTKGQFVPIAVIGVVAVLAAPRRDAPWWRPLLAYLAVGGIGGLWWLRVVIDTHGFTPSGSELLAPDAPGPWEGASFPGYLLERLPDAFGRFTGWYGWRNEILPTPILIPLQMALVGLAVGWLVARRWRRPAPESARLLVLAALPVLLLLSSAYTAYDVYVRNGDQHGLAPRYLYGMAPLFAVAVVGALATIVERLGLRSRLDRVSAPALALGALLGVWGSFAFAQRAFYFTSDVTLAFQRAGIVAPVSHPKAWLALLFVAWIALLVQVLRWLASERRLAST